jgi:hypothetical protein
LTAGQGGASIVADAIRKNAMRHAQPLRRASAAALLLILTAGPAAAADGLILECRSMAGDAPDGSGRFRLGDKTLEVWNPQSQSFQNACADRAGAFEPQNTDARTLAPTVCDITPGHAHLAWTASEPARVMGHDVTLRRDLRLDLDAAAGTARETVGYSYLELPDYDDRRAVNYVCRPPVP